MSSLINAWRKALSNPLATAGSHAAFALFKSYCSQPMPAVPGMSTRDRLAICIDQGASAENAAAREYLYRWNLAVKDFDQCEGNASSIFAAPHPIGL